MSREKAREIADRLFEKLMKPEVSDTITGKIQVTLAQGGATSFKLQEVNL